MSLTLCPVLCLCHLSLCPRYLSDLFYLSWYLLCSLLSPGLVSLPFTVQFVLASHVLLLPSRSSRRFLYHMSPCFVCSRDQLPCLSCPFCHLSLESAALEQQVRIKQNKHTSKQDEKPIETDKRMDDIGVKRCL